MLRNKLRPCAILCAGFFISVWAADICLAAHSQNILITGYWPPTNEMLRKFSTNPSQNPGGWQGQNWEGRGYDVYAYFPEFPGGTGSNPKGNGDFEIDYQDVGSWQPPSAPAGDFWRITGQVHPVAIMSYGQGAGPWEIEYNARNLPSASWSNDYLSPYKPTPAPPDTASPSGYVRHSSLPVEAIAEAVNSSGLGINAWVDWDGNPGAFLCEYMAYHDAWYQSLHSDPCDPCYCVAAGFTHLAAGVSVSNATAGAEAALRATINYLDSQLIHYTISGTVTFGGSPLAGVTMCGLPGNPVTDASGSYSAQVGGGWSGAVTPLKSGYAFNTSQQTYSNVRTNQSAQNYTAVAATAETIQFDAASSNSSGSSGTTLSWSHTVGSGSNRILIVGVVCEDSTASDQIINSVKFNGVNMTQVQGATKSRGNSSSTLRVDLYYMLNPPVGASTVLITYNGTVSYRAGGAISLLNVKQQAPEAAVTNSVSSATSISSNITVPNNGAWIVDVVGHSNSGSFTTSTSTERWDKNSGYHTGAGGTKAVTAPGSNTMSWTYSGSSGIMIHSIAAFAPSEVTAPPPGKAANPNPASPATNVSTNTTLSWSAGSGATSHDVYFGTSGPGTFQRNQTSTTFAPGTLNYNTTYYWRIDEENAGGITTGDVWSFTTNALTPNVVGMTQTSATSAITGAGLVVGTVNQQYSNTVAGGLVISQNPVGGTAVNTGSAVDLVISLGKPVVPNVVGMTQAAATAAITAIDNMQVGTVTQQYSNTVVAGLVISQNPVGGTAVNTGSSVDLVISLGKPVVPNVVGMTQAAATSALAAVTLTAGTITQQYSNTVAAGDVIGQSPTAETVVDTGTAVNMVISLGQPVVPNVVGMTETDANAAITAVDNLTVGTVTDEYSDTVAVGLVISQDPNAGTQVAIGTAVNFVVSLGPQPFTISGYVPDSGGLPLADVKMNGLPGDPCTDASGHYSAVVSKGWSGTVTPTKYAYGFMPPSTSYTGVVADQNDQDYTGRLLTFAISGYILDPANKPVSGVLVTANNGGGADITDANGYYELWVSYNWSGVVTPAKAEYRCADANTSYSGVLADWSNQNYMATSIYDLYPDGDINFNDLGLLLANWLSGGIGDFDNNGTVNFADFGRFGEKWPGGI